MTIEPIDVRDLLGRPGLHRVVRLRGSMDGLATEVASLEEGEPVKADLLLESVVEGILASGRLTGVLALRCVRCLKEFERPVEVDVHELFALQPQPDDEDVYALDPEGWLDPEQMVRDALGLELPFSPLHSPDCLGLCPVCGGDRNLGECPGDHPQIDPRWSGLEPVLRALEDEPDEDATRKEGSHGRPEEEAEQDPEREARRELEEPGSRLRGVPTVPPAQAASPGVRQLRPLRRPTGRRGRVTA